MTIRRCIIWCAVSSEEQAKDDKLSLHTQETEMRAIAQQEGWEIVKVFLWDGYSRWESDPIAALEDFAQQGRYEYHELRRMWRESEFDVLMLYTHSRAGRSFTMQAWVVENVIRHGGEVFRIHGGWISKRDYAFQIGIGGVLSTNDIDRLVEQRFQAMNERAARGLPTSSIVVMSHYVRRDEFGKPLTDARGIPLPLAVKEELRPLWNDAAKLFLEGYPLKSLEHELYKQSGYTNAKGKPHASNMIRTLYHNPAFWGHSARFFNDIRKHGYLVGAWTYDETVPIPEGVLCFRNTHEAVYTGDLADAVRAELNRRLTVSRGHSNSRKTNKLTGLFICAACTYYYGYDRRRWGDRTYTYLYCGMKGIGVYSPGRCLQTKGVSEEYLEQELHLILERIVGADSTEAAFDAEFHTLPQEARSAALQAELDEVTEEARQTLEKQKKHPDLTDVLDEDLVKIGKRRTFLKEQLERARFNEQLKLTERNDELKAIAEVRDMGTGAFWQLSDREINQVWHRLLGHRRFAILDRQIIPRLVDAPPTKRP